MEIAAVVLIAMLAGAMGGAVALVACRVEFIDYCLRNVAARVVYERSNTQGPKVRKF